MELERVRQSKGYRVKVQGSRPGGEQVTAISSLFMLHLNRHMGMEQLAQVLVTLASWRGFAGSSCSLLGSAKLGAQIDSQGSISCPCSGHQRQFCSLHPKNSGPFLIPERTEFRCGSAVSHS